MAVKRPNLAALAEAAGSVRSKGSVMAPATHLAPEPNEDAQTLPPSRQGQKPITGYFPEPVRIQLKMMAAEQGRSMENILGEALNDVFAKYGKPEIVSR